MDLWAFLVGLPVLAGLNPYATAFMLGLLRRVGWVHDPALLAPAFAPLADAQWLALFGVLAIVYTFADKIPGLDHVNDLLHTLIKPFAGAFLAVASVQATHGEGSVPWFVLAAAITGGATLSTIMHAGKAGARVMVTKTSLGTATPFVSVVEDLMVVAGVVLAALAPIALMILAIGLVVMAFFAARALVRTLRWIRGTPPT